MSNPEDQKDLIAQVDLEFTVDAYGFEEELTEENFYIPAEAEYEDFGEEVEEYDAASLWENIRKKKEREGKNYKPAKKGDKDRPDPDFEYYFGQSSQCELHAATAITYI